MGWIRARSQPIALTVYCWKLIAEVIYSTLYSHLQQSCGGMEVKFDISKRIKEVSRYIKNRWFQVGLAIFELGVQPH